MTGREALTSSRQAYEVVDAFEQAVARYTGAPYCVAVDSGCNALFLALQAVANGPISIPSRTYIGVAMAIKNVGLPIEWREEEWKGIYRLFPYPIIDSAKRFTSNMYMSGFAMCLSFHASKLLPIGRGGAIIHDDARADRWFRMARNNGRMEGLLCGQETEFPYQGWNMYMTPPDAARGLWLLTYYPEHMPDQIDDYEDISQVELFR